MPWNPGIYIQNIKKCSPISCKYNAVWVGKDEPIKTKLNEDEYIFICYRWNWHEIKM